MANRKPLSPKALEILEALREGTFTMAQLVERGLVDVNSAQFTALVNRGLISAEKVTVEVPTVIKRTVNAYTVTEKGKEFKVEAE